MNNFFLNELNWIGDKIREETETFHDLIKPLARHYTSKRLIFSGDKDGFIILDPKLGLPTRNFLPEVVFWVADAFGLEDREISKRLGCLAR